MYSVLQQIIPTKWLGPRLFTAREVRQLLQDSTDNDRTVAVRRCMARPGDWLPALPEILEYPFRYHQLLPRIVFWYSRGDSVAEISVKLADSDRVWHSEKAIRVACKAIAAQLNHQPDLYWAGAPTHQPL